MTNPTQDREPVANDSSEGCVFCGIAAGTVPATKIYEDEYTMAFLDIQPVNHGHALVIPKDHFENAYTVPPEAWCRLALAAQKVALAVRHAADADGVNINMNNEAAAGQIVPHAHIHIIPRFNDDGLTHWPHKTYMMQTEMNDMGDKIRQELEK